MKKLIFVLLGVLVVCLGLAFGCGTPPENPPEEPPIEEEYCYITFKQDNLADFVKCVKKGEALLDVPTPNAKTGYTVSWDVQDFSNVSEDLIVKAVYQAKTYTVIYDCTGAATYLPSFTISYGQRYVLDSITYNDYNFLYWTCENKPIASEGVWNIDSETTIYLYPKIQLKETQSEVVYHTVTFVQESHGNVTGATKTVLVKHGEGIRIEDIPKVSQVLGYTVRWSHSFDDLQNVVSDVVVSAVMEGKTYKITYDLQGGVMDGGLSTEQTVIYGQSYTLRTASKEGYVFRGWAYMNGFITDGIYNHALNITVFAVWETEI